MRIFNVLRFFAFVAIGLFIGSAVTFASPMQTFDQTKSALLQHVYFDNQKTLYCGCDFQRRGRNGGTVDHDSCGYQLDGRRGDSETRAARIEFEHIVPISVITRGRPCGNRSECSRSDAQYRQIKADPFNISPAIGEVNALRSNYSFTELTHISFSESFGACDFKFDARQRLVEPADSVKGFIARTYMYVSWAYGMPLNEHEQLLFAKWHHEHPVTDWELTRHNRVAALQGWSNPYVTGEKSWTHIKTAFTAATGLYGDGRYSVTHSIDANNTASDDPAFVGNRNSGIYFPRGCHWYDRISGENRVPFDSAQEAEAAGYRAARNC
ncbi:endonuclease [Aliidiomarina quisquiliarum]|uniref:endonuclease n=1 Tax=Aliidiomarina quisquiliarum TaxID=2938947 RepID=UPI00208EF9AC|nr:endonuclease [Aliidiomarina quisquiliarum]MCO4319995.1 endonuclease [Aliidiomarina quisquiliarum]